MEVVIIEVDGVASYTPRLGQFLIRSPQQPWSAVGMGIDRLQSEHRPHHLSDAKYDDVVVLRQIRLPKIHAFEGRQAKHTRPERPIPVR